MVENLLTIEMLEQLMFSKLNMILKRNFYQPSTIKNLQIELKEFCELYPKLLKEKA